MNRKVRIICSVGIAILFLGWSPPQPVRAQVSNNGAMTLVQEIDVGGMPDVIVVDRTSKYNDVIFYDLNSRKLRFLDGDTLTVVQETLDMPTAGFAAWMVYDRFHRHAYLLQRSHQFVPDTWHKIDVTAVANRRVLGSFSVNASFNSPSVEDTNYAIQGVVLKQPHEEDARGRLIIDNAARGSIDVVDLGESGLSAARVQRHTYRDDSTALSVVRSFYGSTLALDSRHETLAQDDLTGSDLLYIADQNDRLPGGAYKQGNVRVLRLSHPHPTEDLTVTTLPDLNLAGTFPYGNGVNSGLSMAGPLDILYVASGWQSFGTGYAAQVSTVQHIMLQNMEIDYGNESPVLVDWYDPKRAFIAAYDGFAPSYDPNGSLHLHLIYGGKVVDSLRLFDNFEERSLRGMAFDPYGRRLYITVGTRILVVDVNYGAGPAPVPSAPLATGSTTLQSPWYGGTLETSDQRLRLDFGPNSVSQSTAVTCNELGTVYSGDRVSAYAFELTAKYTASGDAVTQFDKTSLLTFTYTDRDLGGADKATLALYRWNGKQWVEEPASKVTARDDRVTAELGQMTTTLNRTGRYAILGETNWLFLPCIQARQ